MRQVGFQTGKAQTGLALDVILSKISIPAFNKEIPTSVIVLCRCNESKQTDKTKIIQDVYLVICTIRHQTSNTDNIHKSHYY